DAPVLVAVAEVQRRCLVNEIGVEDHHPVLAMGHMHWARLGLSKKSAQSGLIVVVLGKIPLEGGLFVPHDQASAFGIEVRLVGCQPEVHVYGREIGMHGNAAEPAVILESPELS